MVKKAKKSNFASFMRKSPLHGVKLDLKRKQTPTRTLKFHPDIVYSEGVNGKRARIAGSGIEVWEIIAEYKSLGQAFKRLQRAYHWLTEQQLKAALKYYSFHRDEIETLIARNEQWTPEIIKKQYPLNKIVKSHETKMVRIPTNRPPTHPGEMLFEEFLKPTKITQRELAVRLRLPYYQVNKLIHGKCRVTLDIARRLGKLFDMNVQFWLNLQLVWDLWQITATPLLADETQKGTNSGKETATILANREFINEIQRGIKDIKKRGKVYCRIGDITGLKSSKPGYKRAQDRQIALMKKGVNMGTKVKITVTREESHARDYKKGKKSP